MFNILDQNDQSLDSKKFATMHIASVYGLTQLLFVFGQVIL